MVIKAYKSKSRENYYTLVDSVGDEGCATIKPTSDKRKIKAQLADVAVCVYGWHRPEIVIVDHV